MGLYLLSTASARDFGWIGTLETVERLEQTLSTMGRLARFRGHFYNWYDTQDLRALDPPYVSTVDSGNLAGHLIALASACEEWVHYPPDDARCLAGIADALEITRETANRIDDGRRTQTVTLRQLDQAIEDLATRLEQHGETDRPSRPGWESSVRSPRRSPTYPGRFRSRAMRRLARISYSGPKRCARQS